MGNLGNLDKIDASYADIRFIYERYIELRKEDRLSLDQLQKINELYEKYKEHFARVMLDTALFKKMENADSYIPKEREDIERYVPAFLGILDGTLQEQGRKFSTVNLVHDAWYSSVFQIGNKILKIGTPRRTYEIPNHRRILQPFIRENFETRDGIPFACVELSEAVVPQKLINYNIVYGIYKELRESGIVWGDAKFENLGVLNDINLPKYKREVFQNNPEFVGLNGETEGAPLEMGDYVIIDTDFLYPLAPDEKVSKDSDIHLINLSERFEEQYQMEMRFKRQTKRIRYENGIEIEERY